MTEDERSLAIARDVPVARHRKTSLPVAHRVFRLSMMAAVTFALVLAAFAWPGSRVAPRHVSVALVADGVVADRAEAALARSAPGAFRVDRVSSPAEAMERIRAREAYGAVILEPGDSRVLTASAASPAVAQLLALVAGRLSAAVTKAMPEEASASEPTQLSHGRPSDPWGARPGGSSITVRDLVPSPTNDPRGAGLASAAIPLTLAGLLALQFAAAGLESLRERASMVILTALMSGVVGAIELDSWLGAVDGNFGWVTLIIGTVALTVAMLLLGLQHMFGRAGYLVGAGVLMLLGNPLSGATSAHEMLPNGWSDVGRWMPIGVTIDLLRDLNGFNGRTTALPATVLGLWLVIGIVVLMVADWWTMHRRQPAELDPAALVGPRPAGPLSIS